MAILNKLACLPSDDEGKILSKMIGIFEIWQLKLVPGDVPQDFVLVDHELKRAYSISSDCRDVQFKFECLHLVVRHYNEDIISNGTKILQAKSIQNIRLVLGTEWIRDAKPDEVPTAYQQIIQIRSGIEDIPKEAPACVSMVGVIFDYSESTGLIYLDENETLKLNYTEDQDVILKFLGRSTVISINELSTIKNKFSEWRVN